MPPGEIFALRWKPLTATYADIRQRVYRGLVDTPKTDQSLPKAALAEGLLADVDGWRLKAATTSAGAWVLPSERMTRLSKDNCWRRNMEPLLAKVGLRWRRTHAILMKAFGVNGKLIADHPGHSLDVNQDVYDVQTEFGMKLVLASY